MTTVPVFVNCRDRVEPLIALLSYLDRAGADQIYLLDNASAYPPLLEFFEKTDHRVIRLGRNVGRLSLWEAGVLNDLGITGYFVFTDPDVVPIADCPLDALGYFAEILDAYPDRQKVGFGLKIDDLPDCYRFKEAVVAWESQFWERPIAPRLYDAPIDTTFALYRNPASHSLDRAIRTGYPYLVRHIPWYLDENALPDDEAFYRSRAEGSDVNHWSGEALPEWLSNEVAVRRLRSIHASRRLDQAVLREADAGAVLNSSAWAGEPDVVDEVRHTPWGEAGWQSWNDMSPEVEICNFFVRLVEVLRPRSIIETGTGQGFVARRVKPVLRDGQRLTCFESDPTWRKALGSLPFFDDACCVLSPEATPTDEEFAANLVFLDSDYAFRLTEIERWWRVAGEGAVLLVHDTGNGHGPETPHAWVRERVVALDIPGTFLSNPRGAFLGIKPSPRKDSTSAELARRVAHVESEMVALRNTKTFRYSAPLRRLYQRIRPRRI